MANIAFTKGGDNFAFSKGRSFPLDDPAIVNVIVDYSEGKQLYAYDKGVIEQEFNLAFERLSQTDYDNFDNWLKNISVGPKNTFTYTDEDGNNHTVRLMDTKNPLKEIGDGMFSGVIVLREEL